jgi:NADH-ubiquinone oxidoreductase chain 2
LHRDYERSVGAGLTYFLLGGLSSCFILLGSALLYASCGLTSLDGIYVFYNIISGFVEPISTTYPFYAKPEIFSLGFLIISVGYLFKVSAAPFHFWSPDVYDALDTITTTFVANIPKISIIIFWLGLVHSSNLSTGDFSWTYILLVSSFLSLIVGTVVGLVQFRIKRLLAYSGISHMGFLLLALGVLSPESIQAFLFYLVQYILTSVNAFFIVIAIGYTLKDKVISSGSAESEYNLMDREQSPIQLISQLKGYFYHNPVLTLSFTITLFSLLGVPPLAGFFAKQLVLSAALQEGYIFLSLVAVLTSVIGGVYYLLIIKAMIFSKNPRVSVWATNLGISKDSPHTRVLLSSPLTITISTITLMILFFILYPNVWLSSANILASILINT